jgi:hypothetical protein
MGIVEGHEPQPFRFGQHLPASLLDRFFNIIGIHVIFTVTVKEE